MRDYNYRKRMKDKEIRRRKELGLWPGRRVNEKGHSRVSM